MSLSGIIIRAFCSNSERAVAKILGSRSAAMESVIERIEAGKSGSIIDNVERSTNFRRITVELVTGQGFGSFIDSPSK
jgi:hypothetical protein